MCAGLLQVGHQLVAAYAACTGLPLYRRRIHGASTSQVGKGLQGGEEKRRVLPVQQRQR